MKDEKSVSENDINDATLEYRNVMKFISCCFTWIDDNEMNSMKIM